MNPGSKVKIPWSFVMLVMLRQSGPIVPDRDSSADFLPLARLTSSYLLPLIVFYLCKPRRRRPEGWFWSLARPPGRIKLGLFHYLEPLPRRWLPVRVEVVEQAQALGGVFLDRRDGGELLDAGTGGGLYELDAVGLGEA